MYMEFHLLFINKLVMLTEHSDHKLCVIIGGSNVQDPTFPRLLFVICFKFIPTFHTDKIEETHV